MVLFPCIRRAVSEESTPAFCLKFVPSLLDTDSCSCEVCMDVGVYIQYRLRTVLTYSFVQESVRVFLYTWCFSSKDTACGGGRS